jgi:hypothetical protein
VLNSFNTPSQLPHCSWSKVRVLKKWTVDDVLLPGKIASVDMILMDKNVSFFVD